MLFLCLLGSMQLMAAGAQPPSRRPLREVPNGEPKTGCHTVVLKKDTTKERLREIVAQVSKFADSGKVYSCEENVLKAFTVKLSSKYALEMVRAGLGPAVLYSAFCMQALHAHLPTN